MYIILAGFTYKQYTDVGTQETKELVYETTFEIDLDQIEAITPATGPENNPEELSYSRIIGKSGRYYDINLTFRELQQRIRKAKKDNYVAQLIVFKN